MKPLKTLFRVLILVCVQAPLFAQISITSMSPAAAAPGQTITLSGSGFNSTPASNLVYFGAVKATVQGATATSLQLQVPVGASYGPIQVFNTGTGQWGASQEPFNPTYSGARGGVLNMDFGNQTPRDNALAAQSVCVADITGDGKPDIIKGHASSTYLSVYVNGSTPGLVTLFDGTNINVAGVATNFRAIRAADLNADGRIDLLVLGDLSLYVLTNTGPDGGYGFTVSRLIIPTSTGGAPGGTDLEIADLNADGKPDIAIAVNEANVANTLRVWSNASSGGTISFTEVGRYPMPGVQQEGRVTIGDLDGDSRPDLMHTSQSNGFQVLRNSGVGTAWGFAARQDFGTGFSQEIGLVDMNADGKRDVVTLSTGTNLNNAYVWPNTSTSGSISFGSSSAFPHAGDAQQMRLAIADLDADGKGDFIYSNYGGNAVQVAQNAGTAGQPRIAPFQAIDGGAVVNDVVCNDIDGDQRPDLVYAAGNTIQVRLMQQALAPKITALSAAAAKPGDNITITGTQFSTTLTQNQVRFGATWGQVKTATATSLQVTVPAGASMEQVQVVRNTNRLIGQSTALFVPRANAVRQVFLPSDLETNNLNLGGSRAIDGTIIDLNGDRLPELVALENAGGYPVSILQNASADGVLDLAAKISFSLAGGNQTYIRLRLADLNGDSLPDICALAPGFIVIRRNESQVGSVSFGATTIINLPAGGQDIEVTDVDGDGRLDIVAIAAISSPGEVQLLMNQSTGSPINFLPPRGLGFTAVFNDVQAGDLNQDGRPELALTRFDGTLTILGNQSTPGVPSFVQALQTGTYNRMFALAIGDIDGDGRNDITTCYDGYDAPKISAAVLLNTGTGGSFGLAAPQTIASNETYSHLALADLSGDGLPEVILGGTTAFTVLVRNNSQPGQLSTTSVALSLENRPATTFSGDLDVDGRTDLVQVSTLQGAQVLLLNKPAFANEPRLASLVPSPGNLPQAFNSNSYSYTMAVSTTTSKIRFTAVPISNVATMRIRINNGAYTALASGVASPELDLIPGNNKVDIAVTAENGTSTITYSVTVRRSRAVLQTNFERSSVCIGTSVRFTATVTNPGVQASFRWYRNGQLVPDSITATYTVSSFGKTDVLYCQYVYKETGDTTTFTLTGNSFGLKDVFEIAVFVDRNETSSFFEPANWLDYKVPGPNTHVIIPYSAEYGRFTPVLWYGSPSITIASLQIRPNSGFYSWVPVTITGNCPTLPDE